MNKKLSTQLYKLINIMEKNSTNTIGAFTDSESVYIWSEYYILNVSPQIYDLDIDNGKKAYLPPRAELERLADAGRGIALQLATSKINEPENNKSVLKLLNRYSTDARELCDTHIDYTFDSVIMGLNNITVHYFANSDYAVPVLSSVYNAVMGVIDAIGATPEVYGNKPTDPVIYHGGITFLQMPTRTGGNALEYWLPTQYTTLKAK